jgi:hypothetical protein
LAFATLALALPALLWLGLSSLPWLRGTGPRLGTYALLPLLWGWMLADHLPLGMAEAGRLLPVSLAPWQPGLAGLPQWQADPHVIGFCQSLVMLVGAIGSALLLRRLLPLNWRGWLLQASGLAALAAAGRWLLAA